MKRFLRSESGVVSVEYVMWLPVIFGIIMMAADGALLLSKQAHLFDINRELTRLVAVGEIESTEIETTMQALWPESTNYGVIYTEITLGTIDFVAVELEVAFSEVLAFAQVFAGDTALSTRVVMVKEFTS